MGIFGNDVSEDRVAKIITRVLRHPLVKDLGERAITRDELIDDMEAIQLELAQEFQAIDDIETLDLVVGQQDYALSGSQQNIREIIPPSTWDIENVDVIYDSTEWAEKVNDTYGANITHPLYAFLWGNNISFAPLPQTAETLTLYTYRLPTVALTYFADPETPKVFDDCYFYELIFKATGNADYHALYLDKARRASYRNFKKSVKGPIRVQHSSDKLGF